MLAKKQTRIWLIAFCAAVIPAVWAFIVFLINDDSNSFELMGVKGSYPLAESLLICVIVLIISLISFFLPMKLSKPVRNRIFVEICFLVFAVVAAVAIWIAIEFMDTLWTGTFRGDPAIGVPRTIVAPTWLVVVVILASVLVFRAFIRKNEGTT